MKTLSTPCALLLAALLLAGCESKQQFPSTFETPAAAAVEFAETVRAADRMRLTELLGVEATQLMNWGDEVQGSNERRAFMQEYDSVRLLVPAGTDAYILEVGGARWPLPLPIVKSGDRWKFDTQSGLRELVLRRIGRNELAVIGVCRGIVAAQQEYAAMNGGKFAAKLRSEPGKHDGLYWETTASEPMSPAGPLIAWAEAQGYTPGGAEPAPYRGYFYRRLEVKDPVKEFAILAYPAEYDSTGIMTFVVNQDGVIYRKNFGAGTADAVKELHAFAPDGSWTPET